MKKVLAGIAVASVAGGIALDAEAATGTVEADSLRVRTGPSTSHGVIESCQQWAIPANHRRNRRLVSG